MHFAFWIGKGGLSSFEIVTVLVLDSDWKIVLAPEDFVNGRFNSLALSVYI